MKNKMEVIELFERYGFDYRQGASKKDFLAFSYKTGFFHNAELVSLHPERREQIDLEMNLAAKQLESLNFSTKKTFYNSMEELENALFNGFFNVADWREKILHEYNDYCVKILSALPSEELKYDYIEVPYVKNNDIHQKGLIDDICRNLKVKGPQLTIIEAPAGFGKTTTSYEIIKTLANTENDEAIPFFTEFSRDRQARVFSHIFIREVDRSFNSVNSKVVIEEVKRGRIVVVLDGFDEILHDSSSSDDVTESFENAEPMLETIGELLTGDAKIILTSRRSAIFDGEVFNEWVERYSSKFEINRYRLEKPEVSDWIQEDRLARLSNTAIDVSRLANPVLLSYLRFVDEKEFVTLCARTELIVEQYFKSMLDREMARQELRMNPEQQAEFLRLIASDMCEKNYTSDSKEKLINTIKEKAGYLINEVRKLYSAKDRPTVDKLATTLSNHAFFDRSSRNESHIEFINEFVFGNYIADNVLTTRDWISSDERFVEPAVLSYAPRDDASRLTLWSGLSEMSNFLDFSTRMRFEWILTGQVDESVYGGEEVTSIEIRSSQIFPEGSIENSVFNECRFIDCVFNFKNFSEVTFINCSFWQCSYDAPCEGVNFYNCKDDNDFLSGFEVDDPNVDVSNGLTDVEIYILTKIWPVGSQTIERLHHFIGVILRTDEYTKREIVRGMKRLRKKEILLTPNNVNFVEVNKDKFGEIKQLLGRV